MDEDEDFAANLRPTSTFGTLGSSDHFDSEDDYDDGDEDYDYEERPTFSRIPSRGSYPNAVGSSPVAVSGTSIESTPDGKFGAAITLFCVLGGAGLGWHFGKFKGAAGGALLGGALRNLYRTNKTLTTGGTAVKQGIVGLVGGAGGCYLLWTANRK